MAAGAISRASARIAAMDDECYTWRWQRCGDDCSLQARRRPIRERRCGGTLRANAVLRNERGIIFLACVFFAAHHSSMPVPAAGFPDSAVAKLARSRGHHWATGDDALFQRVGATSSTAIL